MLSEKAINNKILNSLICVNLKMQEYKTHQKFYRNNRSKSIHIKCIRIPMEEGRNGRRVQGKVE